MMNREQERKRLVELTDNFLQDEWCACINKDILEKFAKHLLDKGVLAPTVKVGETVYYIDYNSKLVGEIKVHAYTFYNGELELYVKSGLYSAYISEWYLTREEAEAKLKEGKEDA